MPNLVLREQVAKIKVQQFYEVHSLLDLPTPLRAKGGMVASGSTAYVISPMHGIVRKSFTG